MVNSLSILGSTGSIGTQTLDVADKLNLKVSALTASTNITVSYTHLTLPTNSRV